MSLQARIRRLRAIAICASWAVWLLALGVALLTRLSQGYVLGIALLGFAPYLIALNLIEPWLSRRAAAEGLDTRLE